ncbi:hypothetical protein Poli38472_000185 [Pythium oligandrum]|uniref:Phosphodiesterase n=1 Tax=Pythium oligandrum TaxID=41045 RepID=A0A8K1CCJ3_PYTOL|nr:hypothetical protein Poli38472_000185 [Pythium oligandrum]|eukprot:TMW60143.1 hypothetical protein Poli38472_000185 [Pythium oligandrum]
MPTAMLNARIRHVPMATESPRDDDGSVRKRRRMTIIDGDQLLAMQAELATAAANASTQNASAPRVPDGRRLSFHDTARDIARRRWRLLQKHVCITQWLSKDLMRRQVKRFALAQESLVDALMTSNDDFMEVFVKIREQFLSLLDAENCFLSFEANRSILEFDGRSIYPSTRAKRGLLRQALQNGQPVHLFHPSTASDEPYMVDGVPQTIDVRSYICLPLVDSDGKVQAVAEIFNSRQDVTTVSTWLRPGCSNGSLHVLRNFVGNLIKAFAKRANISDLVSSRVMAPSASTSANASLPLRVSHGAPETEMNGYPIESLVRFLRHSVSVEHCSVFAYDKDADLLWVRLSDDSWSPPTVKCGDSIIGRAAMTGEPIQYSLPHPNSGDEEEQRAFNEHFGSLSLPMDSVRDVLCIPTVTTATQKLNGVVFLLNKTDKTPFNEAEIAMSINLCRHIGHALHSSELHEAILKAQGKAQTLLDLSSVLFRELETNALLVAIMDAIKKPMNASKCCMFIMDDEKHELVAPVGSDIANDTDQEIFRIPANEGIVGAAAQSAEIINVRDAYRDSRFNPMVDRQTGFVTRSILAVPIKDTNGAVLGVLEMVNKLSKQYFDKDDEELARGIAYYLAIALKNAKLFEAARSAMRRSDALLAMMQVISSSNENVADVFKALVDTACQILNVEHGALFFVDALSKTLFCRVGSNWKGYTIPMGKFIPGIVAESGDGVTLAHARSHPDFDLAYDDLVGLETSSLLCVPVKSSSSSTASHVIAVFYAANKLTGDGSSRASIRRAVFCEEDIKIMNAICNEMSSVIERRAWELVFLVESSNESSSDMMTEVTSSFLSQYTTTPSLPRRRSSFFRQRAPTPTSAAPSDEIAQQSTGLSGGLLSKVFASSKPTSSDSMARIRDWELIPWEYSAPQLVDLVLDMFEYFDLLQRYQVPRATMRRFVVSVKGQYQDIPYHNVYHAFTTLHVSFLIVSSQSSVGSGTLSSSSETIAQRIHSNSVSGDEPPRVIHLLELRDILSVFIAAFCHDMNHNGRTNDFHIRYRTSLAMLYNDQSVLENMHAAACFETMRRPGHDILAQVSVSEYRQMRKSIIRAILATDMHNHAGIVTQLHEKLKVDVFNPEDETHKELLMNAIVHSADISGPALIEKIHVKWSLQLLEEFNMQYEEEVALGMTPTPYMNAKPGSPELGKLNLAFIDSCVFPLWSIMHTFLDGLDKCLENIQSNRTVWIDMINNPSLSTVTVASEESAEAS